MCWKGEYSYLLEYELTNLGVSDSLLIVHNGVKGFVISRGSDLHLDLPVKFFSKIWPKTMGLYNSKAFLAKIGHFESALEIVSYGLASMDQ